MNAQSPEAAALQADAPRGDALVAHIDREGRLLRADERLADLHAQLGGEPGGVLAIPALLDLARHALRLGMRLSRPVSAVSRDEAIDCWCECAPGPEGAELILTHWRNQPLADPGDLPAPPPAPVSGEAIRIRIDPLGRILHVQSPHALSADWLPERSTLKPVGALMTLDTGTPLVLADTSSGTRVRIVGDDRLWAIDRCRDDQSAGWLLSLTECAAAQDSQTPASTPPLFDGQRLAHMFGSQIGPALRQPIGRIIANAETIGGRLEGPLRADYASYAGDIAAAGRHLLALIDDLADLEAIEASGFSAAREPVDLADLARRAAGLLALKAADRSIRLDKPAEDESLPAIGEFRRVLQVLLNLLGNAINYAPDGSMIWLRLDDGPDWASVTVADQGPGMSDEEQQRLFNKWERLGRSGDGGSGLGLYISRRLALAMQGDLTVESAPGQGARFTLVLPKR